MKSINKIIKLLIIAIMFPMAYSMNIEYFKELKSGTDVQKMILYTYIDGVKEGALAMFIINPMNIDSKICIPYRQISKDINAYEIIEKEAKLSKERAIEELFIKGLAREYPCQKN